MSAPEQRSALTSDEDVCFHLRLPAPLYRHLQAMAAEAGEPRSYLIREFIRQGLTRRGGALVETR